MLAYTGFGGGKGGIVKGWGGNIVKAHSRCQILRSTGLFGRFIVEEEGILGRLRSLASGV